MAVPLKELEDWLHNLRALVDILRLARGWWGGRRTFLCRKNADGQRGKCGAS
ncbi:hypothetical protein KCP73_22670 [Salmonella enterica subsp. enterica]|nr:hypothetical protein KCP73_22670 [Salmonella enterica subsp. enterica]